MNYSFNIKDHLTCHHYCQGTAAPRVEQFYYQKGYVWGYPVTSPQVLFVTEGEFRISYDFFLDQRVTLGEMLLLHPGVQFKARTTEGVTLLILRLDDMVRLCDRLALSDLMKGESAPAAYGLPLLPMKPVIRSFVSLLSETSAVGGHCRQFQELKLREYLFLLRNYYSRRELSLFFRPVLNRDMNFAAFILDNYRRVKTVNEFAALYSCSISSFDKKFRRAFGTSAYRWMKSRRVDLIYHEINTTGKTFRTIAEEQGFLSLSQFTDFCKKHLGEPPSRIRQKTGSP